jgi:transposase InsO family protein
MRTARGCSAVNSLNASRNEATQSGNGVRPRDPPTLTAAVALLVALATRLVEDNSVCCQRGHTETDINSWHAYRGWEDGLDKATKGTHPGSTWNFATSRTAPRSPWQNPFAERLVGSIRHDCVDHVIVLGESHLRVILKSYFAYYHRARTHLSLGKDAPDPRPVQPPSAGEMVAFREVGGLHHRYERRAA